MGVLAASNFYYLSIPSIVFDCGSPVNGTFDAGIGIASFSTQTFGSVATFNCSFNYTLQGS